MKENQPLKELAMNALKNALQNKPLSLDEFESLLIIEEADPGKIKPLINDEKTIRSLIGFKIKTIDRINLCKRIVKTVVRLCRLGLANNDKKQK